MAEFQNFHFDFFKVFHRIYKFSSQSRALLYYKALLTRSLDKKKFGRAVNFMLSSLLISIGPGFDSRLATLKVMF